jgi:lipoyl(octanoyl) transferase
MGRRLRAVWLGRRRYEPVHVLQQALHEARKRGEIGDTLLLLEHEPVITLGRGASEDNVLLSPEALRARGIELCRTGRGGDVTWHGPGQLVGYPIVDLAPDRCDVRKYVRDLLEVMIGLAAAHGIGAGRLERHVGVWVDRASPGHWPGERAARAPAKLGAVGVRLSRWVTMHGFAFNTQTEFDAFSVIVPCGIREFGVTSLQALGVKAPGPEQLSLPAAELLCERLGAQLQELATVAVRDEHLLAAFGLQERDA